MKKDLKISEIHILLKKRKEEKKEKKIRIPYSPINKKANRFLPYSTLKPETNSLSPSPKSKGARFLSAKQEINHKEIHGKKINTK